MDAGDTAASLARGHTFTPRLKPVAPIDPDQDAAWQLQPNPHLCAICRLAEAAHARSSVRP